MLSALSSGVGSYSSRHALGAILFWVTLAVWVGGELWQGQTRRSEATDQDGGSRQLLRITLFVGWILAFQAVRAWPGANFHHGRNAAFWAGLAVMWGGVALRFWAFRTLGRYFTFNVMTSADQNVVTAGPYRVIRHPGYAGAMLAMAGLGLTIGNWVSLAAIVLVPLIGMVNRIRVEEAALLGTLGPSYQAFSEGRKRLVPLVW
ncbi:MAG TPA: isoprenylcysteine carboxylmethyltransferase family protein [Acidimicrobiales bacterium]|nr:isoprenylcysteine carboxylmethyltransferase family protein [Acidimicrobiales bacterium]